MTNSSPYRKPYEVDILIRGHRKTGLAYRLMRSIQRNTPSPSYQITYVDNGTPLDAYHGLMDDFPNIQHVRLPFNHGSVRAINVGIVLCTLSTAKYVLILDNDTEIPEGDTTWLERFIGYVQEPSIGAAGATTNFASGMQNIEDLPDTYQRDFQDARTGIEGSSGLIPQSVLVSFALLTRKDVLEKVGMFDERFEPGNYEDFDWTWRLAAHGLHCVVAQSVFLHHRGHQTFGAMGLDDLLKTNEAKFVAKYGAEQLHAAGVLA